mmetsp:Transcript_2559/g.5381  ORF Transcript_2559/g.5381 Transcript_2559/m.5381 type:complete len:86 (+) Transcript_2559:356-613(+)
MERASSSCGRREVQFCSVCFGVRRYAGKFVNHHTTNGYCPVKQRKATDMEKRELRRIRQKARRKVSRGTKHLFLENLIHVFNYES